jgi:predicted XRE-type DNA-binding protein
VFYVATVGETVCPALLLEEEPTDDEIRHRSRKTKVQTNARTDPRKEDAMSSKRFESVWDAIEDTREAAENIKIRSALMGELATHITGTGLTQGEAAKLFGVTQPRISDLMRGKIDLFSIDALVNMITAAGLQVELSVREAS